MNFSLKKPRISKTWIVFGVALFAGLLAAWGARSYLSSQMEAIEARNRGETVNVVVAKLQLRKGDVISQDTVAVRSVPVEYAHSSALLPAQFETFNGKVLGFGAKGGEMILWSMLEGKKVPTFSARVEAGRRAITVPVDEINSISGLLEPGDLIDLMLTTSQQDRKSTIPLLQAVKVMATGQRSVDDPKSGERRQYSTVTLDTTPQQAQSVIAAREAGRITALLRNPADAQAMEGGPASKPSLQGKPFSAERQVSILYGGRSAGIPPEGLRMAPPVAPAPTPAIHQP